VDLTADLTNLSIQKSAGWRFYVNETIQVTSMLYFDDQGDGTFRSIPLALSKTFQGSRSSSRQPWSRVILW
jgi:hypothetical protein